MASGDDLREQLESLHAISVEIAALHEISEIHERALNYGREMTASEFAFTGLLVDGPRVMDVAAITGFEPVDQAFYDQFHLMGRAIQPGWADDPTRAADCVQRRCP